MIVSPSLLHLFSIFKMATFRHLGLSYYRNICQKLKSAPISTSTCKIQWNRTIRGRDFAYFRFSKWRPSIILDLVWRHSVLLTFS